MVIPDEHVIQVQDGLCNALFPSCSILANIVLKCAGNVVCVTEIKRFCQINV